MIDAFRILHLGYCQSQIVNYPFSLTIPPLQSKTIEINFVFTSSVRQDESSRVPNTKKDRLVTRNLIHLMKSNYEYSKYLIGSNTFHYCSVKHDEVASSAFKTT